MSKICEKCGYERQEIESVSEYECPKCGAIYAKVEARLKHEAEELLRQKEQMKKERQAELLCREKEQMEMEKERQAIIARHNEQEEKKRQKANSFQNDHLTCHNCGSMKPSGGVIAIGVLSIVHGVICLILLPFLTLVILLGGSLTGASYLDFGVLRAPN